MNIKFTVMISKDMYLPVLLWKKRLLKDPAKTLDYSINGTVFSLKKWCLTTDFNEKAVSWYIQKQNKKREKCGSRIKSTLLKHKIKSHYLFS